MERPTDPDRYVQRVTASLSGDVCRNVRAELRSHLQTSVRPDQKMRLNEEAHVPHPSDLYDDGR